MTMKQRIDLRHQAAINCAQAAEQLISKRVSLDPLRQTYHVEPSANWMNDPCAMVYFRGEYHLMYQYDPYHITPRGMAFGHVKSRDLAHWDQLPIAIAPSEPFELYPYDVQGMNYGIFTGSAAVDGDHIIVLYCGSSYDDAGNLKQTICLATSEDGVHFEKYEGNPVIAEPPEDSGYDFRDPKLWKRGDTWYALMGSSKDGLGQVLLYDSADLINWRYVGVSARSDGRFGTMWECPDFFELNGKQVLLFSPINMPDTDTCYMVGEMDYATGKFTMENWGKIDLGCEYYAPQTLEDGWGRRIVIGWCAMWHHNGRTHFTTYGPTVERGWCGHMSISRVLSLDADNRLTAEPAPETALLRVTPSHVYRYVLKDARQTVPSDFSKAVEFVLTVDFSEAKTGCAGIAVRCSADGARETRVYYDVARQALVLDRRLSDGIYNDVQAYPLKCRSGRVAVRLFVDSTSLELFADEGRIAASNNIYPQPEDTGTRLFAEGCRATMFLEGWVLRG